LNTDFNICFLCGGRFDYIGPNGDDSGRFCSDQCREAYDSGTPGYYQHHLRKKKQPDIPLQPEHKGQTYRAPLVDLARALEISESNIKRDNNQWVIVGRNGCLFADLEYWYLNIPVRSDRHLTSLKKQLCFMELVSGEFKRERLPSPQLAAIIRKIVGIKKRPIITEGRKRALQQQAAAMRGDGPHKIPCKWVV
jgi:hypothetical protein